MTTMDEEIGLILTNVYDGVCDLCRIVPIGLKLVAGILEDLMSHPWTLGGAADDNETNLPRQPSADVMTANSGVGRALSGVITAEKVPSEINTDRDEEAVAETSEEAVVVADTIQEEEATQNSGSDYEQIGNIQTAILPAPDE